MVLTQPSNITLTSEQMLKVDGTIKKAIVIDAFINPGNLEEKIITVEFFYGMVAVVNAEITTYEGYSNREKLTVGIPTTNESIQAEIQSLWDTKYSALDAGAESIDEMKAFVL